MEALHTLACSGSIQVHAKVPNGSVYATATQRGFGSHCLIPFSGFALHLSRDISKYYESFVGRDLKPWHSLHCLCFHLWYHLVKLKYGWLFQRYISLYVLHIYTFTQCTYLYRCSSLYIVSSLHLTRLSPWSLCVLDLRKLWINTVPS